MMAAVFTRAQPHHFEGDFPPEKVADLEECLDVLFKDLAVVAAAVRTQAPTAIVSSGVGAPGADGEDGQDGQPGPPGPAGTGSTGATGAAGPVGPVFLIEDGLDGNDGFNIPNPGPAGSPGVAGPTGVSVFGEDGMDGEDGWSIQGPAGGGGGSSGPVLQATVSLTDSQIKALKTTPQTLVAAQGAGKVVIPILLNFVQQFTTPYNASSNLSLLYNGQSTDLSTPSSGVQAAAANRYASWPVVQITPNLSTAENLAVVLTAAADITGGNGANTLRVSLIYYIYTF